jgi:predicted aspartyl protease
MTANGLLVLPQVEVDEFHSLGQVVAQFPVLVHTIPLGSQVDGLLGMSFLRRFEAELNFKQATIRLGS